MAETEGLRHGENPAEEQHQHPGVGEAHGHLLTPIIPTTGKGNDHEDDHDYDHDHHHAKKSVLAKVKEMAIKWKHALAKKRHGHEKGNEMPTWEGSVDEEDEEDEEEDPEYHGAPMYKSEMAPETYKETSPRPMTTTNEPEKPLAHEIKSPNTNHRTNEELAPKTSSDHKEALLSHTNSPNTTGSPSEELTTPETPNARKESPFHHANRPNASNSPNKELAMKHADQLAMHYLDEFEASTPRSKTTPAIIYDHVAEIDATNEEEHPSEAETMHEDMHSLETKLAHKEDAVFEGGASSGGIPEYGGIKVRQGTLADADKHGLEIKASDKDPVEEQVSNKSPTETVTAMLAPAYTMVSEVTHAIASKIQRPSEAETMHKDNYALETKLAHKEDNVLEGGASSTAIPEDGGNKVTRETPADANERGLQIKTTNKDQVDHEEHGSSKSLTGTVTGMLAPAYTVVSEATHTISLKIQRPSVEDEIGAKMTYDKGVSVKEYLMHKLEPGEDERALSKAITEAISPRKAAEPGETGVVEKVRNAVSTLLRKEETKGSPIPVSTNPHAVEVEEQGGRKLYTYSN